jgi:hypothetical protein
LDAREDGPLKIFLNSILETRNLNIFIALGFSDERGEQP